LRPKIAKHYTEGHREGTEVHREGEEEKESVVPLYSLLSSVCLCVFSVALCVAKFAYPLDE
jgi:hypothetical protein